MAAAPDDADVIDDADLVEDFDAEEAAPKKKGPPPVPGKKRPPPPRRTMTTRPRRRNPCPRRAAGRAKKRRPADDTEEEPRARRKKKRRDEDEPEEGLYQRLKHNVLVRVITLVVLLGILAVLAYLLYEKRMNEAKDSSSAAGYARCPGRPRRRAGSELGRTRTNAQGDGAPVESPAAPDWFRSSAVDHPNISSRLNSRSVSNWQPNSK